MKRRNIITLRARRPDASCHVNDVIPILSGPPVFTPTLPEAGRKGQVGESFTCEGVVFSFPNLATGGNETAGVGGSNVSAGELSGPPDLRLLAEDKTRCWLKYGGDNLFCRRHRFFCRCQVVLSGQQKKGPFLISHVLISFASFVLHFCFASNFYKPWPREDIVSLSDAGTAALAQIILGPWHLDNQPATVHQETYQAPAKSGSLRVSRCRDTIRKLPGVDSAAISAR